MVWTKEKESFLLKEMAAEGVLTHKLRSKERGTLWQTVAIKMNALGDEVTSRSVRDHYYYYNYYYYYYYLFGTLLLLPYQKRGFLKTWTQ